MVLTADNYYSQEANKEYMSVSQFKDFAGTYGKLPCEFMALEKINGRWEEKKTTALMVGSYVDSYFEGTLDTFKAKNKDLFKNDGTLKADYIKANKIIERLELDMKRGGKSKELLGGEKQVIMTGELFGEQWKIKMDSYIPNVAIVDLKIMKSLSRPEWVRDLGQMDFIRYWGYDIQGAVYQEIVRQNTGKKLPFHIICASKEDYIDIGWIHVTDNYLAEALRYVEKNMPRVIRVKHGMTEPDKCGLCGCCRNHKVLERPTEIHNMLFAI